MARRKSKKRKSKKRKSRTRQRSKSRTRQRSKSELLCIRARELKIKGGSKMTKAQLIKAIKAKQIDLNKKLLLAIGVSVRTARDSTKVKNLLKAGADPNTQDKDGNTPLIYILMQAKHTVQGYNTRGWVANLTNFHLPPGGLNAGNIHQVILGIPHTQTGVKQGEYYLYRHKNQYNNYINLVKLLLKAGANPNLKNKKGNRAYLIAEKIQGMGLVKLKKQINELVKLLKNAQIKRQTKKHIQRQELNKLLKSKWGDTHPGLQKHMAGYLFN